MTNNIYLDNTPVSKPALQYIQGFKVVLVIISTVPFVLGLLILTVVIGHSIQMAILIMGSVCILSPALFIIMYLYISIYPKQIRLKSDNMVIIRNKRELTVQYRDIISIIFAIYSYDYEGKPCPRFVVVYNSNVLKRQIHLTENNAKLLAKYLDEKGITYTWSERARKRWEDDVKKNHDAT